MKILITGTAGFIGFYLAKKLLDRGDSVIGVDQINDYYDIELKFSRLFELGIIKSEIKEGKKVVSKNYSNPVKISVRPVKKDFWKIYKLSRLENYLYFRGKTFRVLFI